MGSWLLFTCPSCGYAATVSGGADVGMRCATQTIVCKTCKELADVVTHSSEDGTWPPLSKDEAEGAEERPPIPIRCPESAAHPVEPWSAGGPCPKCGVAMGEGELDALWD